jgi:hypothetical protein
MGTLWQITAPHFCAGLIIRDGRCRVAAPILGWCLGNNWPFLLSYFQRKGWDVVQCS